MQCFKRYKIRRKYNKKSFSENLNKIYPDNIEENIRVGKQIMKELIICGICKGKFYLHEDKIIANCAGCSKFLHCGIAGKCIGEKCKITINNKIERVTWCINCVSDELLINRINNNISGDCLCKDCEQIT